MVEAEGNAEKENQENFYRCFTACDTCSTLLEQHHIDERALDGEIVDQKILQKSKMITSDPYVTVVVSQAMVERTRVVKNSPSPIWNEYFVIPLAHPLVDLEFQVKDNDLFGAEIISSVKISTQKIAPRSSSRDGLKFCARPRSCLS
ncbi:Phospholipase D [Melia azedarach]|uniref:Phospholipase D n=1 Tax=Melia azedarach TaxID=155640 RepID=A0ACC1XHX5_MELAZ|nr:Phospholipase D [Melia azedarach]